MTIKRLAVYCGSAPGADPAFADAARELAQLMVERDIELVYGGGRLGLMGIVADTVLDAGGCAYGVITQALVDHEVAHRGCTELFTVANMHERKAKMTDLCDAFICLPGGIGTLDEMFEAWTWNALGYHAQPFCLLNIHGFWDGLAGFMDHVVDSGFLSEARRLQLLKADTPAEALDLLDEAVKSAAQGVTW
jgi:uncharacterized protein (TIGR00730 family)